MAKVTLEKVSATLGKVENMTSLLVEGFEILNGKADSISSDMKTVKRDIVDIKEILEGHSKAIDKDATTIIDHERRISKLEHAR